MKAAKTLFLLMFFLICPGLAEAQKITEKSVKELTAKADRAIARKDVNSIAQILSDNVVIAFTISAGGNVQKMRMGKAEYLANLRNEWAMATSFSYHRSNEHIVVSGNSATVTGDVVQTYTIGGNTMRTRMHETATVQLVDGALKVTQVTGESM